MRHNNGLRKLNRTSSHRKSLLRNMAVSLIKYEQIRTTLAKAKTLRPFVEKIITLAKSSDLHTVKRLHAIVRDQEIVRKLIDDIGPRVLKRAGGYTRIYKFGFRYGDSAPMSLIELVDKNTSVTPEKKKKSEPSPSLDEKEEKDSVDTRSKVSKAAPKIAKSAAATKKPAQKTSENKKPTAKAVRRTAN